MSARYFQKIDVLTLLFGASLAVIFFFWRGQGAAASALFGAAVGLLNFIAQRLITAKMIRQAATGERSGVPAPVWFLLKYVGVALALFVILRVDRVDVIAFTAGFFAYIIAIVAATGFNQKLPASGMDAQVAAPDSQVD